MNNLFSKSPETYEKLIRLTNVILTEQRAQRHDLFVLTKMLRELINDSKLQKQVDEYFDEDESEAHLVPETSPQTDQ